MAHIPGPVKRGFWKRKTPLTALFAFLATVSIAGNATQVCSDPHQKAAFWIYSFATIGFVVATVWQIRQTHLEDKRADAVESPEDLTACLNVLHRVIKHAKGVGDTPDDHPCLRMTFHAVRGESLEQCVPYVGGGGSNGPAGRKFSVRSGVMGVAVMSKTVKAADRENGDAARFIEELITKWHTPREEALRVSQDRFSWLAIPLPDDAGQIGGVIWMDSDTKGFFDEATVRLAVAGATGIAAWIRTRYAKSKP